MIDHLTPAEGVVFGAMIALGIMGVAWGGDSTQLVCGVVLAAGFWGGAVTLLRALFHRRSGSLYTLLFILGAVALLVKYMVFPADSFESDKYLWVLLGGVTLSGLMGFLLTVLIKEPRDVEDLEATDPDAVSTTEGPVPEGLSSAEETAPTPGDQPQP